jgi:phage repressor protein C with HTH and peptisase S24 domain
MFWENFCKLCESNGIKPNFVCKELGFSNATATKWKKGAIPSGITLSKIADYFSVSTDYLLTGSERESSSIQTVEPLPPSCIRSVPLFETVSAGFGAYADSSRIGFMPVYIKSDYEAENTLAVKVKGDSMFPKIEDGDTVVVCRDMEWHNGDIVVALIDGDEGVVKRAFRTADHLTLESINPMYPPRRFEMEDMNRVQIVGKVRMIVKEV